MSGQRHSRRDIVGKDKNLDYWQSENILESIGEGKDPGVMSLLSNLDQSEG